MDSFEQLRKFVQITKCSRSSLGNQPRRPPLSSSADFPAAMAQMRTPNTALATTSAIEYPICSYVVATGPARPSILTMYTKGYVSHEMTVRYRAATTSPLTDSGCLSVAADSPATRVNTT